MKKLLTFLIGLAFAGSTFAQSPVPQNEKLESIEDYAMHSTDIRKCISWLEENALDDPMRPEVAAYVVKWLEGNPFVSIEIEDYLATFTHKNPELMLIFMSGWAKYALDNPNDKDQVPGGNLAGLKSMIKFYKAGKGIKHDKNFEEFLEMSDNELSEWLEDKID